MKSITKLGLTASFLFLAACGGGGLPGVDGDGCISGCDNNPTAFVINAESSQSSNTGIQPTQAWQTDCYVKNDNSGNPSAYVKERFSFVDEHVEPNNTRTGRTLVTWTSKSYPKENTTCSGTPTVDLTLFNSYVATVLSEITVSGWVDDTGSATTAPQRADATGSLTAQPKVTVLKVVNGSVTLGATLYIDDTKKPYQMYKLGSLTGDSSTDAYLSDANPFHDN